MRRNLLFVAGAFALAQALLLTACSKPAPIESAEALAENPERLKELQAECRVDRARVGEAQCMAVAHAMRKRREAESRPAAPPSIVGIANKRRFATSRINVAKTSGALSLDMTATEVAATPFLLETHSAHCFSQAIAKTICKQ